VGVDEQRHLHGAHALHVGETGAGPRAAPEPRDGGGRPARALDQRGHATAPPLLLLCRGHVLRPAPGGLGHAHVAGREAPVAARGVVRGMGDPRVVVPARAGAGQEQHPAQQDRPQAVGHHRSPPQGIGCKPSTNTLGSKNQLDTGMAGGQLTQKASPRPRRDTQPAGTLPGGPLCSRPDTWSIGRVIPGAPGPPGAPQPSRRPRMEFEYSKKTKMYMEQLTDFMGKHIYPSEKTFRDQLDSSADRWTVPPIMEELKAKAKERGLWNLFLPESERGAGLTNLEYAPLCEI